MTSIIVFNDNTQEICSLLYEKEYITQSQMTKIIPKDVRTLVTEGEKKENDHCNHFFFLLLDDRGKESIMHDDIIEEFRWFTRKK
jgi:hypothetical protein